MLCYIIGEGSFLPSSYPMSFAMISRISSNSWMISRIKSVTVNSRIWHLRSFFLPLLISITSPLTIIVYHIFSNMSSIFFENRQTFLALEKNRMFYQILR